MCSRISDGDDISAEKQLARDLLRIYRRAGTVGRPVRNASTVVHVEFGLGLLKMDILEKDNLLTMSVWSRYVSLMGNDTIFVLD